MSGLLNTLAKMGALYLIGVIAIYVSSRLMINVCQGTLKNLRDDMFTHMQKLPIRYFDTHSHGELMSRYTNDIDTLRQMISQGIPQIISSGITILGVIIAMIVINIPLTFSVLAIGVVMVFCVKYIGKRSSFFFKHQQIDMGKVNGYVEEMMEGQKVVKVFTHEQQAILQFDQLNERLFESSRDAHIYANQLCPNSDCRCCIGDQRDRRIDDRRIGKFPAVEPQFQPTDLTDLATIQFHHHGLSRSRSDL